MSYEERQCFRCDRGKVLRSSHPMERPSWTVCGHCGGTGKTMVFVVPEAKAEGVVKLYTSYWSCPVLRRTDAVKVSISKGQPKWPRPFRYRRATLLAPSRETFALKSDEAFEAAYLAELEEAGVGKIGNLLRRFSEEAGGRPLVLLCWEKPGEVCHRWQFAKFWHDKTGEVVEELQSCGGSHKRQDLQSPLF